MSFAHATPAQQESPGFSRGEDVKAEFGADKAREICGRAI